jgi:hypothetical protein
MHRFSGISIWCEPTLTYHTEGQHANHYTTKVIFQIYNKLCLDLISQAVWKTYWISDQNEKNNIFSGCHDEFLIKTN